VHIIQTGDIYIKFRGRQGRIAADFVLDSGGAASLKALDGLGGVGARKREVTGELVDAGYSC
jgi:hypothetical protein